MEYLNVAAVSRTQYTLPFGVLGVYVSWTAIPNKDCDARRAI
jgi:hypothetical protein